MKKVVRLLTLATAFLFVVLSFQNCGEVRFKRADSLSKNESASLGVISLINQTVFEKDLVTLRPIISETAVSPSFVWLKDGVIIEGEGDSELRIEEAELSDQGLYEVIYFNNSLELGRAQAQLTVIQQFFGTMPVFASHPQSQTVVEGEELVLEADVSGDPEPIYKWYKNGVEVPNQTEKILRIESVSLDDFGVYKLIASNSNGTVSSEEAIVDVKKECNLRAVSGISCRKWGSCTTSKLNICELIPGLEAGDQFIVTTDVTGSDWVHSSNMKIRSYTFTFGEAKTDTLSSGGKKSNTNSRVYDGGCYVHGVSSYRGKSSNYKYGAIAITSVQPTCEAD